MWKGIVFLIAPRPPGQNNLVTFPYSLESINCNKPYLQKKTGTKKITLAPLRNQNIHKFSYDIRCTLYVKQTVINTRYKRYEL
jgi:hypothetical protein